MGKSRTRRLDSQRRNLALDTAALSSSKKKNQFKMKGKDAKVAAALLSTNTTGGAGTTTESAVSESIATKSIETESVATVTVVKLLKGARTDMCENGSNYSD